jgi:hypothetical protein
MKRHHFYISAGAIAIIIGVLVALGTFKKAEAPQSDMPNNSEPQLATNIIWHTYTNTKYNFEINYPDGWKISEDATLPVINIFKASETQKPPFTIHSNVTAIAIFPEGLGTEGPQSKTRTSNLTFTAQTKTVNDLLLADGSTWATIMYPIAPTSSKSWNEFGFLWAGVQVYDLKITCTNPANNSTRQGECEFGVDEVGQTSRSGSVSGIDKKLEEMMLASFKFLNK